MNRKTTSFCPVKDRSFARREYLIISNSNRGVTGKADGGREFEKGEGGNRKEEEGTKVGVGGWKSNMYA
jgi:hypothetical protein